ncbi:hypothetical protein R9C00_13640 [Flammeovirgaceae bacterium SG7u.111]|nr:hypothetical protein [Flammeovirgaceae bacterium SG7u.132]WPO38497.1 hypothetical protein R9C00_13640 [Flammeovirgaceae bacterium SG7u.111]
MDTRKIFRIIFFILFFGGSICYWLFQIWAGSLPQKYTISTFHISYPSNGGPNADWEIIVDHKSYFNSSTFPKNRGLKEGKRYYVKFTIDYPSQSIMLFNNPVPEYVSDPPLDGWTLKELQKVDPLFIEKGNLLK